MKDSLKATGTLTIIVKDELGNIKTEHQLKNLVVNTGKSLIASLLIPTVTAATPSIMAIGTGTTAAVETQSALVSEAARVIMTGSSAVNVVTYSAAFPANTPAGDVAISEAALYSGTTVAGNGIMLSRTAFLPINKTASDSMVINWQLTIS